MPAEVVAAPAVGTGSSEPSPPSAAPASARRVALGIDARLAPDGHILALDGVRGLAVLLVIFHHESVLPLNSAFDRGYYALLPMMAWCGVDLFFVLSGFLITGILLKAKASQGYFRNFYARRALRILPLYYAVVFFSLVVLPHIHHPKAQNFGRIRGDEVWYWTMTTNFAVARANAWRHAILDISWSLAIEEQFYLLWPLVVLLLSGPTLRRVCVALIGGALLARCVLIYGGANALAVYTLPFTRMDTLAAGALVASLLHDRRHVETLAAVARPLAWGALAVFVGVRVWRWDVQEPALDPVFQIAGYTPIAVCFAAFVAAAVLAPPGSFLRRFLASGALTFFGKYSYAMYLFHLPIRALVRDTVFPPARFPTLLGSALPGQLIFYVIATVPVVIAAWLSWHLYERHFLRLKRFFVTRPGTAPLRTAVEPAGAGTPVASGLH